jgi:predicted outer membrane protein
MAPVAIAVPKPALCEPFVIGRQRALLLGMKTLTLAILLTAGSSLQAQQTPKPQSSATQDIKQAGHEIKKAGEATGEAAKKTGSATKKTTKKAVNTTAKKVDEGAKKVQKETK